MLTQIQIDALPDLDNAQVGNFSDSSLKGNLQSFEQNNNMDNHQYHKGSVEVLGVQTKKYLSSSLLKNCITPTHIKQYLSAEREPSKAMAKGTAMHTIVLEPSKFEYVLFDDAKKVEEIGGGNPRATKAYKEWKDKFETENAGKTILPKEDFKLLWEASLRLDNCDLIKSLMKNAVKESSFFTKFNIDGQELFAKFRPDAYLIAYDNLFTELGIKDGDIIIVSVKTTREASPYMFKHEFFKQDYHVSEAFYYDALSEVFQDIPVHTIVIAIEPETGLFMSYKLSDDILTSGRLAYAPLLQNWMQTNVEKLLSQRIPKGYEVLNGGNFVMEL
jgi:hypothetical protein